MGRSASCVLLGGQEFNPEPGLYDVIWMQWVVGYLPDVDFVEALQRFGRVRVLGEWQWRCRCQNENVPFLTPSPPPPTRD